MIKEVKEKWTNYKSIKEALREKDAKIKELEKRIIALEQQLSLQIGRTVSVKKKLEEQDRIIQRMYEDNRKLNSDNELLYADNKAMIEELNNKKKYLTE